MFSKSNSAGKNAKPEPRPPAPSILSSDLGVVGDVNSKGEIQVDGMIQGDIDTKILLVGESANIKGSITADTVNVHGKITGHIKARSVSLSKTAHVIGDIHHEDLSIEKGAFLEGHCKRLPQKKKDSQEGHINLVLKGGDRDAKVAKPGDRKEGGAQAPADSNKPDPAKKEAAAGS